MTYFIGAYLFVGMLFVGVLIEAFNRTASGSNHSDESADFVHMMVTALLLWPVLMGAMLADSLRSKKPDTTKGRK